MASVNGLLPVEMDPSSKLLSVPAEYLTPELKEELDRVNRLSKDLIGLTADVPPPPNQINGPLLTQVAKLRDSGNVELKKKKPNEAIRYYDLALQMASRRALWEAAAYTCEEMSTILSNRAQAYMQLNDWGRGLVDASYAVDFKSNSTKAFYRKAKCLQKLGRFSEAKTVLESALRFDDDKGELKAALKELNALSEKEEKEDK